MKGITTNKQLKYILLAALLMLNVDLFSQPAALDTTFNIGLGAGSGINELIIQPDGKVIVAGTFTSFDGTPANRIIRLLPHGEIDSTWITAGGGANHDIRASALQSDGKVLIGGIFNTYNSVTANRLVRLDTVGNIDPLFIVGAGPNNEVQGITVNANRIVIQGFFNQYQGAAVPNFAVLQYNGSIDTTFTLPIEPFISLRDFHILPNNNLYLAGNFIAYNGQTVNRIVRLDASGSIDNTFITGSGFDALVNRIHVQSNGDILVAGSFSTYKGLPVPKLIRLHPNGDLDTTFNPIIPQFAVIAALSIDNMGRVYIAGSNAGVLFLKRLLPDGSEDPGFNTATGFNGNITQIGHQSNQKVLVTGTFTLYQNSPVGRIARLIADSCFTSAISTNTLQGGSVQLTANYTSPTAQYQWLDCNNNMQALPGQNSSTFLPGTNGSYAIAITDAGCSDTSACQQIILGLEDIFLQGVKIYPNPATTTLHMEFPIVPDELRLYNITGALVWKAESPEKYERLEIAVLPKGLYILEVSVNGMRKAYRISVE